MNLTASYPFAAMSVGSSFTVTSRFQHVRVAASEYARKHGVCFSCRMQPDRTMIVYRVSNDQITIDNRGRRGRRRIVQACQEPSVQQFSDWLSTFAVGQSYVMPASYAHLYSAMVAWCELHSLKTGQQVTTLAQGDKLLIQRIK